jgi:hypothetical protein
MLGKRFPTIFLALGLPFLGLSCQDSADPLSPVEPQMAKPVKQPKPPQDADPVMQEFWVYTTDTGEQCIHFVVSGTVTGMGVNVLYDHFFNGYQDLHDHYEWYFIGGPPRADTESRDHETLGTIHHEDVCFNGERNSSSEPFKYFMDHPSTSIRIGEGTQFDPISQMDGVAGYDPIALAPAATMGDDGVKFFHPRGVVVGGDTLAALGVQNVTSIWDHDGDETPESYPNVRSFAIWKGDNAPGNIFVEDVSILTASCTLEYGKGKDKNTVLGATVTMDVNFVYGAQSADGGTHVPDPLDFWAQGRIRTFHAGAPDGELSPEYLTAPGHSGTRSYSWTLDLQDVQEDLEVEFALDYLFASGSEEGYDWVYDPGQNTMFTSAGYEGDAWDPVGNVSTELYDQKFPVAHSNRTGVVCR